VGSFQRIYCSKRHDSKSNKICFLPTYKLIRTFLSRVNPFPRGQEKMWIAGDVATEGWVQIPAVPPKSSNYVYDSRVARVQRNKTYSLTSISNKQNPSEEYLRHYGFSSISASLSILESYPCIPDRRHHNAQGTGLLQPLRNMDV
jgi:hypothetical protein